MPWTSKHVAWFRKAGGNLSTADGKVIEVWEFKYHQDQKILSDWAKHFRNHYCLDSDIDNLRKGLGLSRKEYLEKIKFPDEKKGLGPSIRSGDFAEILVADFVQFILGFWVPRTRYCDKTIRNESTKGCDIIGFKVVVKDHFTKDDILSIYEAKAQLTGNSAQAKLQEAINDSIKDQVRKAESLNAIKQKLIRDAQVKKVATVERFQNEEDNPYKEHSGAAAVFTTSAFDRTTIKSSDTSEHPNSKNISLLIIKGDELMRLANELYERAANEA